MTAALFTPITIGAMTLSHRIAMAPLTRFRANDDHSHSDLAIEYYEQRAATPGTMIITEATFISEAAGGYPNVPGLYTPKQIESYKKIVDAVHAKKSFIGSQLWSLGRAAVPAVLAATGHVQVGPSEIPLDPKVIPHSLSTDEIKEYVKNYGIAASNFVNGAGGDFVELHSANGYLLDSFLQNVSNSRTDNYGGSAENRSRFTLESLGAMVEAVGAEKVGIRLSPYSEFQAMKMKASDIEETFSYLVKTIKERFPTLAYIHVVTSRINGNVDVVPVIEGESIDFLYNIWTPSPFLVAGGFKSESAKAEAEARLNSIVAMGRHFISNPDIVERIRNNVDLADYDRDTFYVYGPTNSKGYTDYPTAK